MNEYKRVEAFKYEKWRVGHDKTENGQICRV